MSTLEPRPVLSRLRFPLHRGDADYEVSLELDNPEQGPTFQIVDLLAPTPDGLDPFAALRGTLSALSRQASGGYCGVALPAADPDGAAISFTIQVLLSDPVEPSTELELDDGVEPASGDEPAAGDEPTAGVERAAGSEDFLLGDHWGRRTVELSSCPLGDAIVDVLTVTYTAVTEAGGLLLGFGTLHVPDADAFLSLFDAVAGSLVIEPRR